MSHASWTVDEEGIRLDRSLATNLECSRSRARSLLQLGAVLVDGHIVRDKGYLLDAGQEVQVLEAPQQLDQLAPAKGELVVLTEGDGWVAVDKPAGLPVHPLRADETDSLLQRVLAHYPQIDGVGEGGLRSGVVHRLDVDSSGVQLFALDEPAFSRLRVGFAGHRFDKSYRAIVHGVPEQHGALELDLEIVRHRPAKVGALAAGEGSKASRRCPLRWRLREVLGDCSLVEVRPRTGFLHQIRVSFAWLGHPLLGDALYGQADAPRHMLHASHIEMGDIEATAEDPADFKAVLESLRS